MSGLGDRLQEAERLVDIAAEMRQRHGAHEDCEECRRLDAALGRARAELGLYARAFAPAWWPWVHEIN